MSTETLSSEKFNGVKKTMDAANDNLANDLLKGADEIAEWSGIDRRAIYYAISKGRLPTFRLGSNVFARKSTLTAWIAKQESA